jgi:septation ring formation regulator EzrA
VLVVLIIAAIVFFVFLRKRKNKEVSIEMNNQPSQPPKGEITDIVIQKTIGSGNFSEVFYGVMLVT